MKSNKEMRFERKYIISKSFQDSIPFLIKNNNMIFIEQYKSRTVKSIYFDTENLKFYNQNIQGLKNRIKVRIRWYSDNPNSQLELKIKEGQLGRKIIYPFGTILKQNNDICFDKIKDCISKIKDKKNINIINYLRPTLLVSYSRSYFKSRLLDCRLTLDQKINFYKIQNYKLSNHKLSGNYSIFELKYPSGADLSKINNFSNSFLRYSRFSKYAKGIKLAYGR